MSEINITIEGGKAKRLLTSGKYCDRNIVVTATGGGSTFVTAATEAEAEDTTAIPIVNGQVIIVGV